MTDLSDIFGAPIAVYTMSQALADGTLVDAGDLAQQLFEIPVILTGAVWSDCVAWSETDTEHTGAYGQSETGRLWDVLWMTWCARRRLTQNGHTAVQLYRIPRDVQFPTEPEPDLVTLKATLATHDDATPVVVIGFPEED
jgi:hypothetical protein